MIGMGCMLRYHTFILLEAPLQNSFAAGLRWCGLLMGKLKKMLKYYNFLPKSLFFRTVSVPMIFDFIKVLNIFGLNTKELMTESI